MKHTRAKNSDIWSCRLINQDQCQGPEAKIALPSRGSTRPACEPGGPTSTPRLYLSHIIGVSMPSPIPCTSPLMDFASWLYIRPGSSLPAWQSPDKWQNLLVPPALLILLVDKGWCPSSQGTTCPSVSHVYSFAPLIAQLPSPYYLKRHTINLKRILPCQCCHWHRIIE